MIRPAMLGSSVRRIKRDLVEIQIPPSTDYRLSEPESLEVRLPAEAVQSMSAIIASPQVVVLASPLKPTVATPR